MPDEKSGHYQQNGWQKAIQHADSIDGICGLLGMSRNKTGKVIEQNPGYEDGGTGCYLLAELEKAEEDTFPAFSV